MPHTAARTSVAQLASPKENIRELFRYKKEFLIVDKAEVDKQNYINVLVGSLNTPNETFLIECLPLESSNNANSSIILQTVDDLHILLTINYMSPNSLWTPIKFTVLSFIPNCSCPRSSQQHE